MTAVGGMILAGLDPTSFFIGLVVGAVVGFAATIYAVIDITKKKPKR